MYSNNNNMHVQYTLDLVLLITVTVSTFLYVYNTRRFFIVTSLLKDLRHVIECTTSFEPFNLCLVHCMVQEDLLRAAVIVLENTPHLRTRRQSCEAEERDFIIWLNFAVIFWIVERQRKNTLFLQVCLCEASRHRSITPTTSTTG